MPDDLNIDLSGLIGDPINAISDFLTGNDKSKKKTSTAKKTATSKKTSSTKKTSTAKKASTAKKTTTSRKNGSSSKTATKKDGKIIFEIGGRQIDMKAIERKACKLKGDVYVIANERKIYDGEGNSIDLF